MDYYAKFKTAIEVLKDQNRYREFVEVARDSVETSLMLIIIKLIKIF